MVPEVCCASFHPNTTRFDMVNFGELYSNYQEAEITVVPDSQEQVIPSEIGTVAFEKKLSVFKDGILL